MKTKQDFIKFIHQLVGENKIADALNLTEKYVKDNEALRNLTLLRSQFNYNNTCFNLNGEIIRDVYVAELNKIKKAFLDIIGDLISEKPRFDEKDWQALLNQNESRKKDFLNPSLNIEDNSYKKKIITIIEYILKRSVDKTFDALELCTLTIETNNSDLPHAYEYRALCNYIITPIEAIMQNKAIQIIEDLDFAKKIGKSDNYDKIAEFIGYNLKATLSSLISRLKSELDNADKVDLETKRKEILNYILSFHEVCYVIYPSISLKKKLVEELCGHNELAWLDFKRYNLCDDSYELKNNYPNYSISILDYITTEVEAIKQIDPSYKPPTIKRGGLTLEPEDIPVFFQRIRHSWGVFLMVCIFILIWFILNQPLIALILTAFIIFSVYRFRNKIPCVWRFISFVDVF